MLDTIEGTEFHLFGVHHERRCAAAPGEIIAQRTGAICRATVDGAVWITHLKRATPDVLQAPGHARARARRPRASTRRRSRARSHAPLPAGHTFREIAYEEHAGVGYLHFDFYNGAMSTEQCRRLHQAYRYARSRRQTKRHRAAWAAATSSRTAST